MTDLFDWTARRAEAVVKHEAGERVILSLLEGSPIECCDDRTLLGALTKVEDYGHDRAFRFTFEYESGGATRYYDSGTTVQRGSISDPAHSNWASD